MTVPPARNPGPWRNAYRAADWRIKRLRQFLRVRLLSWRHRELLIAGIRVPISDGISDNVRDAMFKGGYEAAELRTIDEHLSTEDRVLELGTGIGLISSFCAKRIGSENVFTFEANPELEPVIRELYSRNAVSPNLEMCLLGAGEGETSFFLERDFWSSSTVRRSASARRVVVRRKDVNETVKAVQPTFLIADIEGGEVELFEHLRLDGIRKIAVELHTHIVGQEAVDKILAHLKRDGFAIAWRNSTVIEGHKQELFLHRVRQ